MFRRSYFSHVLPPEIRWVPRAGESLGLSATVRRPDSRFRRPRQHRYNPIMIYDGQSTDDEIYRQFWFQTE